MIPWENMAGNSRSSLGIFCHGLISKTVITLLLILISSAHARPLNFTFSHRPRTHPNSGQPNNSTSGNTNSSMVVRVIVSSSSSSFSSSSSSAESIFPFPRITTTVAPDAASTSTQIRPTTYRPQVPYFRRNPDDIFSVFYRAFSQEGDPNARVNGYPGMRSFHHDSRFGEQNRRSSFPSNQFPGFNTRISDSNVSSLTQRSRFSDYNPGIEPSTQTSYLKTEFSGQNTGISDSNTRISDSIDKSSDSSSQVSASNTRISDSVNEDPIIPFSDSNTRFPDPNTRAEPNISSSFFQTRTSYHNTPYSNLNTRLFDSATQSSHPNAKFPDTRVEPNNRSSFPSTHFAESNTQHLEPNTRTEYPNTHFSDTNTRNSDPNTRSSDTSTRFSDSILEIPTTRFSYSNSRLPDPNTRFSDPNNRFTDSSTRSFDPAMSDSRNVETFQLYSPTGRTSEAQAKAVTVVSQSRSVSRAQPNPSTHKALAEDHHYQHHNVYSSRDRMISQTNHAASAESLDAQNQEIFKLPRPEPLTQANPNDFGTHPDLKKMSSTQSSVVHWEQPERVWGEPEKVWGQPEQNWGKPEQRHDTLPATTLPSEEYVMETEVSKFYELGEDEEDEPKELVINKNAMDTTIESAHLAARSWELPEVVSSPNVQSPTSFETMTAESIQVPKKSPNPNAHFHQVMVAKEKAPLVETSSETPGKKFGYVLDGSDVRKYRVEERTPDGYIVGEYGVINHDNGFLRGVRYTADGTINPRLIHEALMKFLSL